MTRPDPHDFGTLRELLHRPPSHRSWLEVLEVLHAAHVHDEALYAEQLLPYARSMLQNQWPRELRCLSIRETSKYAGRARAHVLELVTQGVTIAHGAELLSHVERFPEVFIARANLMCRDAAQRAAVAELLREPRLLRGIEISEHVDWDKARLRALVEVEQPHLERLVVHGSTEPALWAKFFTQSGHTARLTHLEFSSQNELDRIMAPMARASLDGLTSLKLRGAQKVSPVRTLRWLTALTSAPWFAQLERLAMGDDVLECHDHRAWQGAMEALTTSSIKHLSLYGWQLGDLQVRQLCEAISHTRLESLRLEHMGLTRDQIEVLFETTFPHTMTELHIKGQRWDLARLIGLAARPGVRHVSLNLNARRLNHIAKLAARPEAVHTIRVPPITPLRTFVGMEVWQHVRNLELGHGTDDTMRTLLDAPVPQKLARLDIRHMHLSMGMWLRLLSHPHYGDARRVRLVGEMDEHAARLHGDMERVVAGELTRLSVHSASPPGTIAWLCIQPWAARLEHLDLQRSVSAEDLREIEETWELGGFPELRSLHIERLFADIHEQLRFLHSEMARQVDISVQGALYDSERWLAGTHTHIRLHMNDVRAGALKLMVEHALAHPTTHLAVHDWVDEPEVATELFAPIAALDGIEDLSFEFVNVDVVAMTRWVLANCPHIRALRFAHSRQSEQVASALLALDDVARLDVLDIEMSRRAGQTTFAERFRVLRDSTRSSGA